VNILNFWNTVKITTGMGNLWLNKLFELRFQFFRYAFPGCRGVWGFDNATTHNTYATDALIAYRIRLGLGAQTQHRMREGFDHVRGLPHPMVFSDNYLDFSLRGKPKGLKPPYESNDYGLQVAEDRMVSSF
jgi:hypothetical protein